LNMQLVGFGPVSGVLARPPAVGQSTDDMVLRDTNTGALRVYDIQNDAYTGNSFPLNPPTSKPIAPTSTVGGMAIDFSGLALRLKLSACAGNGRFRRQQRRGCRHVAAAVVSDDTTARLSQPGRLLVNRECSTIEMTTCSGCAARVRHICRVAVPTAGYPPRTIAYSLTRRSEVCFRGNPALYHL
jgi:hypothetical protein